MRVLNLNKSQKNLNDELEFRLEAEKIKASDNIDSKSEAELISTSKAGNACNSRRTASPPTEHKKPTVRQNETKSQLEPKPESNLGQTEAKLEPKPESNLGQTEAKLESKSATQEETWAKLEPQLRPKLESNLGQTEAKLESNGTASSLVGLQRNLLQVIFKHCFHNASLVTSELSIEHLSKAAETTIKSTRKALQRLEQKRFIQRFSFKEGRGGWTKYQLPKDVYNEMLQVKTWAKLESNLGQTEAKLEPQLRPQLRPTAPSSSNYIYINKRTTTTSDDLWELVQTPQLLKDLGLGKNHIDQIKSKFSLSPEEVGKSLEAFAFDLANGELERLKAKNINPINYLFGAIKQGGYCPVNENFKTAEELAEEEMIARLKKQREAKQKRAEDLRELLFEEWLESKTAEELCNIAKPVGEVLGQFHKVDLKSYFLETEFERMYQEYKIQ